MPVLPMIDLLILMGWTSLSLGGVLKAISVTTSYRPEIMMLGPYELLMLSGICLLFALALAARTWVKANEPEILARQRRVSSLHSVVRETGEFDALDGRYAAQGSAGRELPPKDVTGP